MPAGKDGPGGEWSSLSSNLFEAQQAGISINWRRQWNFNLAQIS